MNVKEIVDNQRIYFKSGETKSYSFRKYALLQLKRNIEEYKNDISTALWKDLRKSEFEAYLTEIAVVTSEIGCALKNLKKWMKAERKSTPLISFPSSSKIVKEPYGVVLIISPWNYPFQLVMSPLIGAIAAGNCVVIKPSPSALATRNIMDVIISKSFDKRYIALINADNENTNLLLKEPFDYIMYTGGVEYGKNVMRAAAEYLTPVTLELGGKSPCIVDSDANLKVAARRIIWGKLLNCGQTCIAPDYLMVHTAVKSQLVKYLITEITNQFGDDAMLSPDYPRIINTAQYDRLVSLLKDGDIIEGGQTDDKQRYIAPTLLENVTLDSKTMQEEIFGPILPIIEFDTLTKAIDYINSNEKPLALYYFGESSKNANLVISTTSSGGACINDLIMQAANPNVPFGGIGNSGMGAYHGKYSFDTFSHSKAVIKTTTAFNIDMKFAPYKNKLSILSRVFK